VHASAESADDPRQAWAEELRTQREEAKRRRDFAAADRIRDELRQAGFEIRDNKDGSSSVQRAG